MNVKLSLVAIGTLVLVLVGCGGGSDSSNSEGTTLTEIKTVEEAKNNFKALSALSSFNNLDLSGNTQNLTKRLSLKKTNDCESGTVTITDTATTFLMVANNCTVGKVFINGTMSEERLDDGSDKMTMSNLTMKDGTVELRSTKFVAIEKESEHWSKIDGDMNIISKCFSGTYDFKTIEKIYDAQDGSDNAESGVLELNGVRYTFSNPYVTIKTGSEEKTILQSELEKQMNNASTCSE